MADETALDRFREFVLADEPLQLALSAIDVPEAFAALALEAAAREGIALVQADLAGIASSDPLGLSRFDFVPPTRHWPPRHWLPVEMFSGSPEPRVSWAHFAGAPLSDPFFAGSTRRVASRPFNRLMRFETALGAFVADPAAGDSVTPSGFIFHMSRCGSTLLAQMLAALPGAVVVSEAPPLDAAVQLGRVDVLQAMVAALGRRRSDTAGRYFLKCDSWHALALPLFRRAFPKVPWVFLYREPVEILVSQMRLRGMQTVPHYFPPLFYGFDGDHGGGVDYCARVLARTAEGAIEAAGLGGGLFVDYSELPGAVASRILPHFGVQPDEADEQAMAAAASRNAKRPDEAFVADSASKRDAASEELREAAGRHMAAVHRRLRSPSLAGQPTPVL